MSESFFPEKNACIRHPLIKPDTVEQRLYQLIRQPGPIVDRKFEIEFLDAGVEAFSFTFG